MIPTAQPVPIVPEIEETGERMVYLLRSDTNPRRAHRVDLPALGGFSECSCKSWRTRAVVGIKAGLPAGEDSTTCKHVRRARTYLLNEILRRVALSEQPPQTKT